MSKEQTATVPVKAPPELIDSMVLRFDHGAFAPAGQELNGIPFGFQTEEERMRHINYLRTCMRQVHEEVVGTGFYKYPDAPASPSPAGGVQAVTDEMVERAAKVIDPQIVPLITEYCQRKGYTAEETADEFARSGRWAQAREKARETLTAVFSSSQAQTTGGVE